MQQSKRTFTFPNGNAIEFTFDSRHQELYDLITNLRMSRSEFKRRFTSEPEVLSYNVFKSGKVEISPFYVAVVVGNVAALNGIVDNMYRTITFNESLLLGAVDLSILFKQEQSLAALMKHPFLFFEWDRCGINGKAYKELVKMLEEERVAYFRGDERLIQVYKGFDRVFKENYDPDKETKYIVSNLKGCFRSCVSCIFTVLAATYLVNTVSQEFSSNIQADNFLSNQMLGLNSSLYR